MKAALLEYFTTQDKTWVFVIRPEDREPNLEEIPYGEDFWAQYRGLLYDNLTKPPRRPGKARHFEREIEDFYELGTHLIEPVLPYLHETDLLYIVPHQTLHYLPFHAMKIKHDSEYVHLIEAFQVVYLPSSSVLKFCRNKNPMRQGRQTISHPLVMGTWADNDPQGYIDSVGSELRIMEDIFSVNGLESLDASKGCFLQNAGDSDLIHIACHGYFVPSMDTMSSSGILLNNGKTLPARPTHKEDFLDHISEDSFLSAREILNLKLDCHLVTLSACEVGHSDTKPGDELIGMTRSLLYAGSPSVLLALWPVDIRAKHRLMQSFYANWTSHMREGKSRALKAACYLRSKVDPP